MARRYVNSHVGDHSASLTSQSWSLMAEFLSLHRTVLVTELTVLLLVLLYIKYSILGQIGLTKSNNTVCLDWGKTVVVKQWIPLVSSGQWSSLSGRNSQSCVQSSGDSQVADPESQQCTVSKNKAHHATMGAQVKDFC